MPDQKWMIALLSWSGMEDAQVCVMGDEDEEFRYKRVRKIITRNGAEYVMKRGDNIPLLEKEIRIIATLDRYGVPVAVPVKNIQGEEYVIIEGELFCLYPRLHGQGVKEHFTGDYLHRAQYFGKITGLLHLALKECEEWLACEECDLYPHVTQWAIPVIQENIHRFDREAVTEVLQVYIAEFALLASKLPTQLIHRDIHTENMLFENGKVTGFLDFELSQKNVRIFDPCYIATGILSGVIGEEEKCLQWIDIYHGILWEYDGVVHLIPEEKQALWYVLLSIQMIFVAYFLNCNLPDLAEQNAKELLWIYRHKTALTWREQSGSAAQKDA